jgi:hypothetical protein
MTWAATIASWNGPALADVYAVAASTFLLLRRGRFTAPQTWAPLTPSAGAW